MNLHDYDDRCVRIIDNNSDIFDGICIYNNAEYDEHEFGRNEESLQICNFLFYKCATSPNLTISNCFHFCLTIKKLDN